RVAPGAPAATSCESDSPRPGVAFSVVEAAPPGPAPAPSDTAAVAASIEIMISTLWRMLQFPSRLLRLVLMTLAFIAAPLSDAVAGAAPPAGSADGAEGESV